MNSGATLRPMGIGDILDGTFKLYTRNFVLFVSIYAATLVPTAVLQILGGASGDPVTYLVISLIVGLAALLPYLALVKAVSVRYLGGTVTVGEAYSASISRLLVVLGASILAAVLAIIPAITVVGIIATIYLGIRWALIPQTAVLEPVGVRGAMGRSWAIVGGYWWKTFLTIVLLSILVGILSLVLGMILGLVAGALGLVTDGLEGFFGLGQALPGPATVVINTVVSIFISPLQAIGITLVYYDLRVRKEGYDLERMAEDLSKAQGGAMR